MSLVSAIQKINKKYGEGTIAKASECDALYVSKIPTGSLALDIALRGGWPEGRMIELSGAFSACKTTLSLATAKEYLRLSPKHKVVFADAEHALDKKWLEKVGLDLDRFYVMDLKSGEDIAQAIKVILYAATEPLLLIIDSLAHLVPMKEIEAEQTDKRYPAQAMLINSLLRVITPALRRSLTDPEVPKTTVLFLNQIRDKMSTYARNSETTPGGRGKEYATSVHVQLRHGGWLLSDHDEKVGRKAAFVVKKNKTGPPEESGEFDLAFKPGQKSREARIDNWPALLNYGVLCGVIEKRGPYYVLADGSKYKGEETFYRYLSRNPKRFRSLTLDVISEGSAGYEILGRGYQIAKNQEKPEAGVDGSEAVPRKKTARKRKSARGSK